MNEKGSSKENQLSDPNSWVDKYGDYLYRYAVSRVQDSVAAEDLVQETFLGALNARGNFKGRSSERTWLSGILKHKIIDYFRKQKKEQPFADMETTDEFMEDLFDGTGNWRVGPNKWPVNEVELVARKEFWEVFYRCLSELSGRLGRIFILREMEGLSTREICNVFNITATNCWVMLYRARTKIRHCLEIKGFNGK